MFMQPHRKSEGLLLIWLVMFQAGCRGWIEKPVVPDTGVAIPRRGTLRVTKTDGAVMSLKDSFVTSDSIVGFYSDEPLRRVAIARTEVTKVEVRGDTTPRGVRIAGKVYLGVLTGVGLVMIVTVIMWGIADSRAHL
jgi:hypothetical protein